MVSQAPPRFVLHDANTAPLEAAARALGRAVDDLASLRCAPPQGGAAGPAVIDLPPSGGAGGAATVLLPNHAPCATPRGR